MIVVFDLYKRKVQNLDVLTLLEIFASDKHKHFTDIAIFHQICMKRSNNHSKEIQTEYTFLQLNRFLELYAQLWKHTSPDQTWHCQ